MARPKRKKISFDELLRTQDAPQEPVDDDVATAEDTVQVNERNSDPNEEEGEFKLPWKAAKLVKRKEKLQRPNLQLNLRDNNLSLFDAQNFMMWALTEEHGSLPRWLVLQNRHLVTGIKVALVPGLDYNSVLKACDGFNANERLPFFFECLKGKTVNMRGVLVNPEKHAKEEMCPFLKVLLEVPIPSKHSVQFQTLPTEDEPPIQTPVKGEHSAVPDEENEGNEEPMAKRQKTQNDERKMIKDYMLTEEQLTDQRYPRPLGFGLLPPGYLTIEDKVVAKSVQASEDSSKTDLPVADCMKQFSVLESDPEYRNLLALDCEMVMTEGGSELARVSVVDYAGRTVLDTFVRPENYVTDYLTKHSGITPELLRDCETSFREAQHMVLNLMTEKSILVGHSLENDLIALKIIHDRVIDTSEIYVHPRGPPAKLSLAMLSFKVLREKMNRDDGHDSIDDSRTALRVALKKFVKGPSYNPAADILLRVPIDRIIPKLVVKDGETTFERLKAVTADERPACLNVTVIRDFQEMIEKAEKDDGAVLGRIDAELRRQAKECEDTEVFVVLSVAGNVYKYFKLLDLVKKCTDSQMIAELERLCQLAKNDACSALGIFTTPHDLNCL